MVKEGTASSTRTAHSLASTQLRRTKRRLKETRAQKPRHPLMPSTLWHSTPKGPRRPQQVGGCHYTHKNKYIYIERERELRVFTYNALECMILLSKGWGASRCSETFVWGVPMLHTDLSVPLGRRGGLSSFSCGLCSSFFILEIFNLPLPPPIVASIKETEIQAPDLWHINCVSTQLQNVGKYVYHIDISAVNDLFFFLPQTGASKNMKSVYSAGTVHCAL